MLRMVKMSALCCLLFAWLPVSLFPNSRYLGQLEEGSHFNAFLL